MTETIEPIEPSRPIRVIPYDPKWGVDFRCLAERLVRVLRTPVRIEHIGSTSVAGLAAKPILDIDVVVADRYELHAVARSLVQADYDYLGERCIADRHSFRAKNAALPRHNLYVCLDGCAALRNHLAVRDALRADPSLRERYSALKLRLAAEADSIDVYCEGKSELILGVLAGSDLDPSERSAIRLSNRVSADPIWLGALDPEPRWAPTLRPGSVLSSKSGAPFSAEFYRDAFADSSVFVRALLDPEVREDVALRALAEHAARFVGLELFGTEACIVEAPQPATAIEGILTITCRVSDWVRLRVTAALFENGAQVGRWIFQPR